jgi:hypothetical protein
VIPAAILSVPDADEDIRESERIPRQAINAVLKHSQIDIADHRLIGIDIE